MWMTSVFKLFRWRNFYSEDFESDNGDFTITGSSSWEWGAPSSGPNSAHSGTNAWATNLSGFYSANEDSSLVSPTIDASNAGNLIILSWWQYLVTEAGNDVAAVDVSKDSGTNWISFYGPVSGTESTNWMQRSILLDSSYAVANLQFRFYLQSSSSINNVGFLCG